MKTFRPAPFKRAFTLLELMVAITITTIIVSVLVSVTSIALDTWNRSRSEIRASRQAKSMADTMARDFEALVTRRGNNFEWLDADASSAPVGPESNKSTNATKLTFFTSATDRYNGDLTNTTVNKGGDVSCVSYQLAYKDPIDGEQNETLSTFVLYRKLADPDMAFEHLLGQTDLVSKFNALYSDSQVTSVENFVCENIFQFTVTFHVEVQKEGTGNATVKSTVPVVIGTSGTGNTVNSFKILGNAIDTDYSGSLATADQVKAGRVAAIDISITVITDFGIDQMRRRKDMTDAQRSEFLLKNSYQYTKLVQLPGM